MAHGDFIAGADGRSERKPVLGVPTPPVGQEATKEISMRRSLWLTWFYVGTDAFLRGPAAAQTYEPVTARQLLQNPPRYLGHRIELTNAYCASVESGKYECTTSEPLVVRTGNVATPDSRKIMEEERGGLDTTELTPTCRFNLRFVPITITSEQGIYKHGTTG